MASTSGEEHPMPTMASAQGVAALVAEEDAISNAASTSSNQLASGDEPLLPGEHASPAVRGGVQRRHDRVKLSSR